MLISPWSYERFKFSPSYRLLLLLILIGWKPSTHGAREQSLSRFRNSRDLLKGQRFELFVGWKNLFGRLQLHPRRSGTTSFKPSSSREANLSREILYSAALYTCKMSLGLSTTVQWWKGEFRWDSSLVCEKNQECLVSAVSDHVTSKTKRASLLFRQ